MRASRLTNMTRAKDAKGSRHAPYLYSEEMDFLPVSVKDKENGMKDGPSSEASLRLPLKEVQNLSRISERTEPNSERSSEEQNSARFSMVSCHKHLV